MQDSRLYGRAKNANNVKEYAVPNVYMTFLFNYFFVRSKRQILSTASAFSCAVNWSNFRDYFMQDGQIIHVFTDHLKV